MTEQQNKTTSFKGGSRTTSGQSARTQVVWSNEDPAADSWIWSVPMFEMKTGSAWQQTIASPPYANKIVNKKGAGWASSWADKAKWRPLRFSMFLMSLVFIAILIRTLSFA